MRLARRIAAILIAIWPASRSYAPTNKPVRIVDARIGTAPEKPSLQFKPGSSDRITALLDAAADRHGVPRDELRKQAWIESRLTDVDHQEKSGLWSCGPLQVYEGSHPGICEKDLREKIEAGAVHFASVMRYGTHAGYAYIHGHYRGGRVRR